MIMRQNWETTRVITEGEWTRKYRVALLERNRSLRMRRIQEAREAMKARSSEIASTSPERLVIDRALDILTTLREASIAMIPESNQRDLGIEHRGLGQRGRHRA
jgi:hypothetical protein